MSVVWERTMNMELIKPGTKLLVNSDIVGIVNMIQISGDDCRYQCYYWNDGEREEGWFHENELRTLEDSEKIKIGFKDGS